MAAAVPAGLVGATASSQASSHFPLEPVTAATLAEAEGRRRREARARGACASGCAEVDDCLLLGGLERGCVVGVSAEEEDFGVMVCCSFSLIFVVERRLRVALLSWLVFR